MQPLFIFSRRQSIISKLIRKLSNSKFSHVAMTLQDRYHTLESSWKNPTTIEHFSYPKGEYEVCRLKFDLRQDEIELMERFIFENLYSGYDWKFILSRLGNRLLGTPVINSKQKYNCDELILEAIYYATSIRIVDDMDNLTPEKLYESSYFVKVN